MDFFLACDILLLCLTKTRNNFIVFTLTNNGMSSKQTTEIKLFGQHI